LDESAELTAVEARRLIGERELSSLELVDACIAQIERIDPAVNAMVVRADDHARQQARDADASARRGEPLRARCTGADCDQRHQDTAGYSHHLRSETLAKQCSFDRRAGIVARIRAAGGIVIGKTNVPEFSIGANTVNRLFGATGNPFDVSRTCGGSSGGSAVAVATNMAPLATGSDHGGSLRIPACYSGVVGYRATPGVVPNERRTIMQTNYSVQGPMARTVADTALLLSVIGNERLGAPRSDGVPARCGGLRSRPSTCAHWRGVTADLGGVLVSESIAARSPIGGAPVSARWRCDWHSIDLRAAPDVDWHVRQDCSSRNTRVKPSGTRANPNVRYGGFARRWRQSRNRDVRRWSCIRRCGGVRRLRRGDAPAFRCRSNGVSESREIDGVAVTNYMAWLALTSSITVVGHPVVALPRGLDEAGCRSAFR
jgi:Asp-tRNA(Asn)/Glu-tRNA(Gln) amidotransferase A subunit family amidase